jgi:hypothetical protein
MKGHGIAYGPIGQRYRLLAARVRGLVGEAKSTEVRSEFLRIALLYESLADYMRDLLCELPQKRRWWLISARSREGGAAGRRPGDINSILLK